MAGLEKKGLLIDDYSREERVNKCAILEKKGLLIDDYSREERVNKCAILGYI